MTGSDSSWVQRGRRQRALWLGLEVFGAGDTTASGRGEWSSVVSFHINAHEALHRGEAYRWLLSKVEKWELAYIDQAEGNGERFGPILLRIWLKEFSHQMVRLVLVRQADRVHGNVEQLWCSWDRRRIVYRKS